MRQTTLRPQFVEFIPEQLEDGVLYISQRYGTAMHLCCCGCGSEVVTPLNPAGWTLEIVNGGVTLRPSIGSWSLPCRSHYLIRQGRVVWARDMSREEIEDGRVRDQRLRDVHFADVNRGEGTPKESRSMLNTPMTGARGSGEQFEAGSGWATNRSTCSVELSFHQQQLEGRGGRGERQREVSRAIDDFMTVRRSRPG